MLEELPDNELFVLIRLIAACVLIGESSRSSHLKRTALTVMLYVNLFTNTIALWSGLRTPECSGVGEMRQKAASGEASCLTACGYLKSRVGSYLQCRSQDIFLMQQ